MKDEDSSWKNPTVVKANSLIQAGYRLSLAEQRTLLSAIAQIGQEDQPTDQTTYSVDVSALADIANLDRRKAWEHLRDTSIRLFRREVRIEHGPNGSDETPQGGRICITGWVQSIFLVESEGRVELRFSKDILPYLSMLQSEFTSYKLRHVARMKSTHGVRLYELLQQWRQTGGREIEIDELKRMFGVAGKYASIGDFKKYVIEKATADVNACSDLHVEWGQRKRGRRVAAIQFKFKPKNPQQLKPEASSQSITGNRPNPGATFDPEANRGTARRAQTVEAKDAAKRAMEEIRAMGLSSQNPDEER